MTSESIRIRVWDWSIRAFHWLLVPFLLAMWWTAEEGYMVGHKWLGVGLLALLTYRLIWGLIGPTTARLLKLIPRPSALFDYIKSLKPSTYQRSVGHSPIGGLAVLALLTALWVQTVTGLFTIDVNGLASGWFGHLISFEMGREIADIHEMSFDVLLALIGLHLVAIAAYGILLRANLIGPMISGDQVRSELPETTNSISVNWVRFSIAIGLAALCAVAIIWFGR